MMGAELLDVLVSKLQAAAACADAATALAHCAQGVCLPSHARTHAVLCAPTRFTRAVAAADAGACAALVECLDDYGGCAALVVMTRSRPRARAPACAALAHLCSLDATRAMAVGAGAVPALIEMLGAADTAWLWALQGLEACAGRAGACRDPSRSGPPYALGVSHPVVQRPCATNSSVVLCLSSLSGCSATRRWSRTCL